MKLNKDAVLDATGGGLAVFHHYLPESRQREDGRAFKNPLYEDTKPSCHLYQDKPSGTWRMQDFGDPEYHFDCFGLVAHLNRLNCRDAQEFIQVLRIINRDLGLGLESGAEFATSFRQEHGLKPKEARVASEVPPTHIRPLVEQALSSFFVPEARRMNERELAFWAAFGIDEGTLERYHVYGADRFAATTKDGREYVIRATEDEPLFIYKGKRYAKLYRPFSERRFQYAGDLGEGYCFGLGQLPHRGDILFITGGEKDVMSLAARGFNAISFNSETATIKLNLIRRLSYRFRHIVLLFDMDETGRTAMEKQREALKEFRVLALALPLPGTKESKDISDYFRRGYTGEDLMELFKKLLDQIYADTLSLLQSFEVRLDRKPRVPEPVVGIEDITIGSSGNILALTGPEGSGKSNYLAGLLAGTLAPADGPGFDTLGTQVSPNHDGRAVLLYDTEQSDAQLYRNLEGIARRAGLRRFDDWFKAYALVGMQRKDRLQSIFQSMDRLYYEHGGIHLVVIDGVADLVDGVNDEESAVALIDELFRLAGIYQTCIVCVLHLSPSGYKLRGHLGSEISRKASGILSIEKESGSKYSIVKALKVREGSPLEVPMLLIGWDDERRYHTFQGHKDDNGGTSREERKITELRSVATPLFERESHLAPAAVVQGLCDALHIKERQAKTYLKFMVDHRIVRKTGELPSRYILVPE